MTEVVSIYPANDFRVVEGEAVDELESGIIIGYNAKGELTVFGGGMIDGRQPVQRDWLWMVETFKQKMISGDYAPE